MIKTVSRLLPNVSNITAGLSEDTKIVKVAKIAFGQLASWSTQLATFTVSAFQIPAKFYFRLAAITAVAVCLLFHYPLHPAAPSYSTYVDPNLSELYSAIGDTFKSKFTSSAHELQPLDELNEELGEESDQAIPRFIKIEPESLNPLAPAVLYAPGYLGKALGQVPACQEIANKTGARVYIVEYRCPYQAIENHAEDIYRLAQKILLQNEDIVIGAHSKGGLATGYCINKLFDDATRDKIKLWFTIATPFKGTNMARLGGGICAKQMVPNSEFLKNFSSFFDDFDWTRRLHISTKTDLVVPYVDLSHQKDSAYTLQEHAGHRNICESDEVITRIVDRIKAAMTFPEDDNLSEETDSIGTFSDRESFE